MLSFRKYFFSLLLLFSSFAFSQNRRSKLDSIFNVLHIAKSDTAMCSAYIGLSNAYVDIDHDSSFLYAKKGDSLAERSNDKRLIMNANFSLGKAYTDKEMYSDALKHYFEMLPLAEELGDKRLQHRANNNVGNVYSFLHQTETALKYSLLAAKEAGDLGDKLSLAKYYVNIGTSYKRLKKRSLASEFYFKALQVFGQLKYKKGVMQSYINIATLYAAEEELPTANDYLLKALPIADSLHDMVSLVIIYENLGGVNAGMKNFDLAIRMFDSTIYYSKKMGAVAQAVDVYAGLADIYAQRSDYKKAYYYSSLHSRIQDSIFNSTNLEQIANDESKYNFLSKEKELELLRKNDEIKDLENNRKNFWILILVLGFLLLGVLVFLFYYRYQQKNKQTSLLQIHNSEIELRKKEMTDSITYAKRIQMSILPPDSLVNKLLPDSFVLYKPKDIVSGDFYWVEECDGKSLFAAVDCTGHGVPGAMMSVLGFNLLSQSVNEQKLTKPSSILEHLDLGVDKMLRQSTDENSVRDGMDLSLCCLDYKTGMLQFAGAYNPLWIIKDRSNEFIEVKADKMMIGVNAGGQGDQFTNHEMQLQKGDTVYIFSDGYADQFGGSKGKKFKYKPMKEFLIANQKLSMNEQKNKLDEEIERWRGDLEQVDDILVIGVRL